MKKVVSLDYDKEKIKTIGVGIRLVTSETQVEKVFKDQTLMMLQPQKEVYKPVEKKIDY